MHTGFCSHRCVKFSLLILATLTLAFMLDGCTTLANRRDLYSPVKPSGPYTDMLAHHRIAETNAKAPINSGAQKVP